MQHLTTYQQITRALTVLDIAEPITFKFDKSTPIGDVLSELGEDLYTSGIILVNDREQPYGFITSPNNLKGQNQASAVETVADKIDPGKVLLSSLSLYELLPLWRHSYFYFILNGSEITHFVSKHHMDSAPVKTALFAMTAEFEELILRLLMKDSEKIKERFEILNSNERRSAKKLSKDNNLPENSVAYLQCTLLSAKIKILLGSPDLIEFAFPEYDPILLERNLNFIKDFRNEMAHGGSIFNVVRDVAELPRIIETIETVNKELREKLK